MENIWVQTHEPKPKPSKVPLFTLVTGFVSLVSLVISVAILKINKYGNDQVTYKKIGSYQYMFACILVGLGYIVLQTPFAAYYAFRRKRLVNHSGFLFLEFCADKVILCILGTAVGAAFGATKELKYMADHCKDLKNMVDHCKDLNKHDRFFNMNFLASGFLLVGFICSAVLSLFSSRPVPVDE